LPRYDRYARFQLGRQNPILAQGGTFFLLPIIKIKRKELN